MTDLKRRTLLRYLLSGSGLAASSGLFMGPGLLAGSGLFTSSGVLADSDFGNHPTSKPLLSAARGIDGHDSIRIFSVDHAQELRIPLPARAHQVVPHPLQPEAICIARRPGLTLQRFDYLSGHLLQEISPPSDRRLYGHGVFSPDGRRFYTTENDFNAARGVIGIYAVDENYHRLGELESGGIGPHQLGLHPDGKTLVIANGGIQTHPKRGREKLNLETMQPNLAYIDRHSGALLERHTLSQPQLSIRHLDIGPSGQVALGMQYQGVDGELYPLVAHHHRGLPLQNCQASAQQWRTLSGYIASVLLLESANTLVASSPRGNRLYFWSLTENRLVSELTLSDTAGLARIANNQLVASTGQGILVRLEVRDGHYQELSRRQHPHTQWDNHLASLSY